MPPFTAQQPLDFLPNIPALSAQVMATYQPMTADQPLHFLRNNPELVAQFMASDKSDVFFKAAISAGIAAIGVLSVLTNPSAHYESAYSVIGAFGGIWAIFNVAACIGDRLM